MVVSCYRVVLVFVDILTMQLYCKTIASISIRRKRVMEQAFFLFISLYYLFPIFIKSYLVLIAIAVAVIASHLAFC